MDRHFFGVFAENFGYKFTWIGILVCVVMAFTLLTIAAKGMTNVNKQRLEKMKNENLTKVA